MSYCGCNPVLSCVMRVPLDISDFPLRQVMEDSRWLVWVLKIDNKKSFTTK